MFIKYRGIHIGLRTLKSAAAVVIAMAIVSLFGVTTSRLIFAMLGAMAAMETTFIDSLESCFTQIVGVFFGVFVGVFLIKLPIPSIIIAGIGIVVVITAYNALGIRFSPSLPCLIVVTLCTTPEVHPFIYALGRCWDTAIGIIVGMMINTLVFPYDNSQKIHATVRTLNLKIIEFMEEIFDGDNEMPDMKKMTKVVEDMEQQLTIFSEQWPIIRMKKRELDLETFKAYQRKARLLTSQMEVLCHLEKIGRLNEENRERLTACGAKICDERNAADLQDTDIVTNHLVDSILDLRQELLAALNK